MSDEPLTRACRTCGELFVITPDEQTFYQQRATADGREWRLPKSCTPCRRALRLAQSLVPTDTDLQWHEAVCCDCGSPFVIGPKDVDWLKRQGWPWPRRCPACRKAKRALHGDTVHG